MSDLLNSSYWHSEEVFQDSSIYFDEMINCINNATQHINIDFYIFKYDALGKKIIDALIEAAKRKVDIRVVIDGVGSEDSAEIIASILTHADINVHIFRPIPWSFTHYRWSLKVGNSIQKMFYFLASLNRRDHRKLCTVDSTVAFCGSLNIAQYHIDAGPGSICWHDYGVKLTGENVSSLDEVFSSFWTQQELSLSTKRVTNLLSNTSPSKRKRRNELVSNRISNAQQRITILTAYFSPSGAILGALAAACARGVEVSLIIGKKSDVHLSRLLISTYYADLLKMGVRVFEYQTGILHAKVMLIDDECIIGSSNLNHRSYYHDLELDVILTTPSAISTIQANLTSDLLCSSEVKLPQLAGINKIKMFGWLPRLFRYWS